MSSGLRILCQAHIQFDRVPVKPNRARIELLTRPSHGASPIAA